MRKLLALAIHDFKIQLDSPMDWVFFLVAPVIFTVIVGLGLGGTAQDQDSRLAVAIVDADGGALAAELRAALEASDVVRIESTTMARAEIMLGNADVAAIVSLPAGFSQAVLDGEPVELLVRTSPDNRALAAWQTLEAEVSRVGSLVTIAQASVAEAEKIQPFASEAEKQAFFQQAIQLARQSLEQPAATVKTHQATQAVAQAVEGFAQSSPGQMVSWTLITFLGTSTVLVYERVLGTLRRLIVMPASRGVILGGKLLGHYCVGLVQMAILILFGWAAFGVNWGRDPLALALVALSYALAATSLGLLLSTLVKTTAQAANATVALSMLLSALGGAWWPLEVTPPVYQTAVRLLPTSWAMAGFTDVIVRGSGAAQVLPQVAVLLLFAAGFFIVGIWRFKYE